MSNGGYPEEPYHVFRNKLTGRMVGIPCPYGMAADRLWARETHKFMTCDSGVRIVYRADMSEHHVQDNAGVLMAKDFGRWRPSIFMFRWASRLTLEIAGIRPERLQDISEGDAIAEGIKAFQVGYPRATGNPPEGYVTEYGVTNWVPTNKATAVKAYQRLWESINAKRGYEWDANPWVWRIAFRRLK